MKKKKSLGQHFLTNPQIAEKIVSFLKGGEVCVEIGPGEGILTSFLVSKFTRLYLIEKDSDLICSLKTRFPSAEIVHGDVLKEGEALFKQLSLFSVASNLPYNISSPITILLLKYHEKIPQMVLMYQKEVADKIAKQVSLLSCLVYPFYSVREVMKLKPGAFSPPPQVDSSVLYFEKKEEIPDIDFNKYLNFLKIAFDNKRKILKKRFKCYIPKEKIDKIYDKLGISEKVRIDGLSQPQIFELYREIRWEL